MDGNKVFGVFPDGFRMPYKELLDLLLTGETPCGPDGLEKPQSRLMKKLVAEHGGDPRMYFSEGGIEA